MQLSISGSKIVDNNFRVDGININDFANTAPGSSLGTNLGVDAIQEFSVLTGNFSAQYGRASGGIINAVTRSGTNEWHGSAYQFHRNAVLDAANFFDNFAGVEKPSSRRHQFGGTLGGPIQEDKIFLFFNYEGVRAFSGTTQIARVFSDEARLGNLTSGNVTINEHIVPYLPLYPRVNIPGSVSGDVGFFAFPGDAVAEEDFFTGTPPTTILATMTQCTNRIFSMTAVEVRPRNWDKSRSVIALGGRWLLCPGTMFIVRSF